MKVRGLARNDAKDGVKWRALSWGAKGSLPQEWEKWPQNVCLFVYPQCLLPDIYCQSIYNYDKNKQAQH